MTTQGKKIRDISYPYPNLMYFVYSDDDVLCVCTIDCLLADNSVMSLIF